jgi:spermidine/putrescine-binding protein
MNKQLTKKTIGIAASAALMASVALSGSALAAPPADKSNKQGPQASASVSTWCEISNEAAGDMTVHIVTENKSSGDAYAYAQIASANVDLQTKDKGNSWEKLDYQQPALILGVDYDVTFNLCGLELGKAINAETSIKLDESMVPASKEYYSAQCGNAPGPDGMLGTDDDITGGGLKTADYPNLCTAQ